MKEKKKSPVAIVAGAFLMLFTCIGLGSSGLTLFYTPVTEDLGFTQASFSLYFSLSVLSGMFFMPFIGKFLTGHLERILPITIACGFLTLLSFLGYAFCHELWQFYAVSIFRGIITSGISPVPATILINYNIEKNRNKAIAIAFTGSSFGGIAYTQISRIFIAAYGWRAGYAAVGVAGFITIMAAAFLISSGCRNPKAQEIGTEEQGTGEPGGPHLTGYTLKEALASPMFYLFLIGIFAGSTVVMGVQQGVVPALTKDHAFPTEKAAMIYSLVMIFMCVGKLFFGWLADKTGSVVTTVYIGVANMLAMMLMFNVGISSGLAYVFAVVFGFANMTATVLMTELTLTIFGNREYGAIYGFVNLFANAGISLGPLITALCVDMTGTYQLAWILYFILSGAAMVIFLYTLKRSGNRK